MAENARYDVSMRLRDGAARLIALRDFGFRRCCEAKGAGWSHA